MITPSVAFGNGSIRGIATSRKSPTTAAATTIPALRFRAAPVVDSGARVGGETGNALVSLPMRFAAPSALKFAVRVDRVTVTRRRGRPEPRIERARRGEPHRRIEQCVSGFLLQLALRRQRLERREIAGCGRRRRCGGGTLFLLVAMPLIEPLPKATLGVIIVVAAAGLINVGSIWRLRRVRPAEVGLALVAFGGVLSSASSRASSRSRSRSAFSSTAPRDRTMPCWAASMTSMATATERFQSAETDHGLLVYRFDAPPYFVNAEYLHQRVLALADARDARWVVLNAEAWTSSTRLPSTH